VWIMTCYRGFIMDKLDEYHMEISVLVGEIETYIDIFNESCTFIENNFEILAKGREEEVFQSLMSIQIYGNVYVSHFEDEKKKVEIFENNDLQLYQCLCTLRKMVIEIQKIANKVQKIEKMLQ